MQAAETVAENVLSVASAEALLSVEGSGRDKGSELATLVQSLSLQDRDLTSDFSDAMSSLESVLNTSDIKSGMSDVTEAITVVDVGLHQNSDSKSNPIVPSGGECPPSVTVNEEKLGELGHNIGMMSTDIYHLGQVCL